MQGVSYMISRRERKKEKTRENIISCAVSLFREKGFKDTSMELIAEKADVSKGTLYNYFQDKEFILIAYFQLYLQNKREAIKTVLGTAQDIGGKLDKLLDFINRMIDSDRDLATIYLRFRMQTFLDDDPFDNPRRSGLEKIVLEIMKGAQEKEEIRGDFPALVLTRNFLFLVRSYLIANMYSREPLDTETLKKQLVELFLNGAKQ